MSVGASNRAKSCLVNEPVVFVVHPWNLVVTENQVALVPRAVPWTGLVVVCVLFFLFCGLLSLPVLIWGDPGPRLEVLLMFGLFATFNCILITTVVFYSHRVTQEEGPPLLIDREQNMVHVAKHDLCVPMDQVEYLEVRNDMPDDEGNFRHETNTSELVLVVRDGEERKRYLLMACSSWDYYDPIAREIAKLDILPVKRVKGVPGSTLVYEKWLTPAPPGQEESSNRLA